MVKIAVNPIITSDNQKEKEFAIVREIADLFTSNLSKPAASYIVLHNSPLFGWPRYIVSLVSDEGLRHYVPMNFRFQISLLHFNKHTDYSNTGIKRTIRVTVFKELWMKDIVAALGVVEKHKPHLEFEVILIL